MASYIGAQSSLGGDYSPPPLFASPLPGPPGPPGSTAGAGTNGTNGIDAFTRTTAPFTQVAGAGTVNVSVVQSAWMAVGQAIFIAGAGYYTVTTINSTTSVLLTAIGTGQIVTAGNTVATNAAVVAGGYAVDTTGNTAAIATLNTTVAGLTALIGTGSVKTSFQGTAPSSPNVGDLWFNSSLNNQIEMWNGSGWVVVSAVPTILNNYNTAQGIQPVQIVTTMPGSPTTGELALYQGAPGTYTPHTMYTWTGSAWQPVITTITPSMITTGFITAGMIAAGAITASAVGTNLLITTTGMIGSAVITAANISTVSAGSLQAGTITGQTIQLSGGSSIIQSTNYVTGSTGWAIKGDGSAEFSNVTIRGNLVSGSVSNGAGIFNSGAPTNTMSSTASTSGGASPFATGMNSGGLFYSLVSFYGWASGLGGANSRFGKSSQTFLCSANYAFGLASSDQGVTNIIYRINGGSWNVVNPWAVATIYPKSGDSISYAVTITGLSGTEQIDFGTKHTAGNGASAINQISLVVVALNF